MSSAPLSRRSVLVGGLVTGGALLVPSSLPANAVPRRAPALVRGGRPALTHGVQSGDVGATSATVWARSDRPARMLVEVSLDPEFTRSRTLPGAHLGEDSDYTGKTRLTALPPGRDVHYRITPVDPSDDRRSGEPATGHLRTPPARASDVSFLWSGDLAGQGWGIDRDRGGYRIFAAMRDLDPDFYLCNGDNIYADNPLEETVALPDGTTWHNVVTEEKSNVAQTLAEFRGNYKYNLLDDNLRAFYADVAQIQQWDDHETLNNWWPGEIHDDDRYTERRVDVLAARSNQAWHEYTPIAARHDEEGRIYRVIHHGPLLDVFVLDMRWYKDPNSANKQTFNNGGVLGHRQAEWLRDELSRSRATWKVIANDLPLGMVVPDGDDFEAVSQGDQGEPLGREIQIAELLSFLKREEIRNVVWLTTDVHFTAAHYFDPARATFTDFYPFWQFVSGPLHAGGFPQLELDSTFGCEQVFVKAPTEANVSPATDYQFFGQVHIDAQSKHLTVKLRDVHARVLWERELRPYER
ncbi:MAG: alkaline phosphatase [Streptosporangiales bacterium]|nr:alkaline phosphatase [Streptosporangiales bacterium]